MDNMNLEQRVKLLESQMANAEKRIFRLEKEGSVALPPMRMYHHCIQDERTLISLSPVEYQKLRDAVDLRDFWCSHCQDWRPITEYRWPDGTTVGSKKG